MRQADEIVGAGLARDGEASVETRPPLVVAGSEHRRADDDLRRGDGGVVLKARGQLDRLLAPAQRQRPVPIQHPEMRLDPIGGRQFA